MARELVTPICTTMQSIRRPSSLPGVRRAVAEVAGPLPECGAWNTLVEERAADAARPAAPRRARATRSAGAARQRAAATPTRHGARPTACTHRHRRVRSRARRRHRARIAGAARRRARHRQVHAAAAGGGALRPRTSARCSTARARSREHQIKSRGDRLGVGDAPLYLLAETCLERDPRRGRAPQAGAARRRLDPDGVLAEVPVGAGQRRPGARGGDAVPVRGQGPERADVPRRPRHQGRQPRRAEGARARRRHGALLRGRAAPLAPRRARGEEPVRRGQRARRLRDDRRPACSRCRTRRRCSSPSGRPTSPGSAVLCCVEGSRPLLVEVQALVSTSTYGNARRMAIGIDQQPAVAAAGGAREARRA